MTKKEVLNKITKELRVLNDLIRGKNACYGANDLKREKMLSETRFLLRKGDIGLGEAIKKVDY